MKEPDAADQSTAGALLDGPEPETASLPLIHEPQQLLARSFQVERPEVADDLGIGVDLRHPLDVTLAPATQPKPRRLDLRYLHFELDRYRGHQRGMHALRSGGSLADRHL